MNLHHIWCDLRPDSSDIEFADAVDGYLGRLREEGRIHGDRLTRRKLGRGPRELGEFYIQIEVEDLAQLDGGFGEVSRGEGPIESLHHAVNRHASRVDFALYRDFSEAHRERVGEKF